MKQKTIRVTVLLLVLTMVCSIALTGCGKKIKAGDYTGSVAFDHTAEVEVAAMGPGGGGVQTIDKWGANVTITVDEDGIIWNVVAEAPEGATMTPSYMAWTVFGGKFLSSITGIYSCADIMAIKVDTEADGFPVLTGDCSGIHLADKDMTLLNDHEVACALIILAIQDAIVSNGLN